MHRYSEEQKEFIITNNYGKYSKELAEMFNQHFNTNITAKEIAYFRRNNKLNSGLTGQFKKGNVAHNKGKKQIEYMSQESIERTKKTRFKKGNIIIQVSASKGQIFYLDHDTTVESQYIVLKDNKVINTKYLYYVISDLLPEFLAKYQTGINIQPEVFKYMELVIHNDIETQNHIVNILDKLDERTKKEEELLLLCKDFKEYHLNKMFC